MKADRKWWNDGRMEREGGAIREAEERQQRGLRVRYGFHPDAPVWVTPLNGTVPRWAREYPGEWVDVHHPHGAHLIDVTLPSETAPKSGS